MLEVSNVLDNLMVQLMNKILLNNLKILQYCHTKIMQFEKLFYNGSQKYKKWLETCFKYKALKLPKYI